MIAPRAKNEQRAIQAVSRLRANAARLATKQPESPRVAVARLLTVASVLEAKRSPRVAIHHFRVAELKRKRVTPRGLLGLLGQLGQTQYCWSAEGDLIPCDTPSGSSPAPVYTEEKQVAYSSPEVSYSQPAQQPSPYLVYTPAELVELDAQPAPTVLPYQTCDPLNVACVQGNLITQQQNFQLADQAYDTYLHDLCIQSVDLDNAQRAGIGMQPRSYSECATAYPEATATPDVLPEDFRAQLAVIPIATSTGVQQYQPSATSIAPYQQQFVVTSPLRTSSTALVPPGATEEQRIAYERDRELAAQANQLATSILRLQAQIATLQREGAGASEIERAQATLALQRLSLQSAAAQLQNRGVSLSTTGTPVSSPAKTATTITPPKPSTPGNTLDELTKETKEFLQKVPMWAWVALAGGTAYLVLSKKKGR